ncbi:MAG: hypothetical protein ACYC0T_05665 [Ramlibacter sp.]
MGNPFSASTIDFILTLALAPADQESSNRFSLEDLSLGSGQDGAFEIGVRRLAAASLRVASGPFMLEVKHLALHRIVALVRIEAGRPRLQALESAGAELSGVKVQAPVTLSRPPEGASRTHCLPMAAHRHPATARPASRPPVPGVSVRSATRSGCGCSSPSRRCAWRSSSRT